MLLEAILKVEGCSSADEEAGRRAAQGCDAVQDHLAVLHRPLHMTVLRQLYCIQHFVRQARQSCWASGSGPCPSIHPLTSLRHFQLVRPDSAHPLPA